MLKILHPCHPIRKVRVFGHIRIGDTETTLCHGIHFKGTRSDDEDLPLCGKYSRDWHYNINCPCQYDHRTNTRLFWPQYIVLVLVLVSLPFSLIVEWRVIKPLRRLIESITGFAKSPFDKAPEWKHKEEGIIDEAYSAFRLRIARNMNSSARKWRH